MKFSDNPDINIYITCCYMPLYFGPKELKGFIKYVEKQIDETFCLKDSWKAADKDVGKNYVYAVLDE